MSILPGGVPQLGTSRTVVIHKRRILQPATCELREGGVTIPGCDMHVEIINVATGVMYLVPVTNTQLGTFLATARYALKVSADNHNPQGN